MDISSGKFITCINDDTFDLMISEESDLSLDGGWTFEMVTSCFELSKENAMQLIDELEIFIAD